MVIECLLAYDDRKSITIKNGSDPVPFKANPEQTGQTRAALLEASFTLFSQKNIETVSMEEAANAAGYGVATMYRYFSSKPKLVVAVATWKWSRLIEENRVLRRSPDAENMTAAEVLEFYLDSFIALYQNNRDMLRFNQFFNIYIRAAHIDDQTLSPYRGMIAELAERIHVIYEKAAADHTVRTDVSEEKMFLTTLHLMLAAVTRYAVGLVYQPESEAETMEELETLKRALMKEYVSGPALK